MPEQTDSAAKRQNPTNLAHSAYIPQSDAGAYLIYGNSRVSLQAVEVIRSMRDRQLRPVAIIDDDPTCVGGLVGGLPVVGTATDLEDVAAQFRAEGLLVADPEASADLIAPIIAEAQRLGLALKAVTPLVSLINEAIGVHDIIEATDATCLRGRSWPLNRDTARRYLSSRRVLVTGAGGSIGSELCRQLALYQPAGLILLDHDESLLHAAQLSMTGRGQNSLDDLLLVDIRDEYATHRAIVSKRPDVIIHTAALKHVPLLEKYPSEAFNSNVMGILSVLKAAAAVGAEKFINISTDKADDPSSAYGYSKRIAERLTASFNQTTRGIYTSLRLSNILGSRGSVLPTFQEQIKRGGPITITHPRAVRTFLTAREACDVVIGLAADGVHPGVLSVGGGRPIPIERLANALIRHYGRPVAIEYTGLREGERVAEPSTFAGERLLSSPFTPETVVPLPPNEVPPLRHLTPSQQKEWLRRLALEVHRPGGEASKESTSTISLLPFNAVARSQRDEARQDGVVRDAKTS